MVYQYFMKNGLSPIDSYTEIVCFGNKTTITFILFDVKFEADKHTGQNPDLERTCTIFDLSPVGTSRSTVYPKKYAHGFVVLCFVVVMQSFIMHTHEVFIHIHQGCFAGIGAIVRLPQCQWSKPEGYGKISQCITTTKHSKAKTLCIFLGIYCNCSATNMKIHGILSWNIAIEQGKQTRILRVNRPVSDHTAKQQRGNREQNYWDVLWAVEYCP